MTFILYYSTIKQQKNKKELIKLLEEFLNITKLLLTGGGNIKPQRDPVWERDFHTEKIIMNIINGKISDEDITITIDQYFFGQINSNYSSSKDEELVVEILKKERPQVIDMLVDRKISAAISLVKDFINDPNQSCSAKEEFSRLMLTPLKNDFPVHYQKLVDVIKTSPISEKIFPKEETEIFSSN